METQIVEMYFNQISLLIYPVVSSGTLLSLNSAEYSNVPALTKINALIQSLMGCDETAVCSSLLKNTSRLLKSGIAPVRFNEEELSLFIVNNIIEPLFAEEDENDGNFSKIEYTVKQAEDLISYEDESSVGDDDNTKDSFEPCSMDVVDVVFHTGGNLNQLHFLRSSIFINDLYGLIGNDIFRIDDKLLNELLIANPYESLTQTKSMFSSRPTTRKQNDQSKRYDRSDANFRARYDYYKRPTSQRKYQKRNFSFERTYYHFDSAPKLWAKDSPKPNMQPSARIWFDLSYSKPFFVVSYPFDVTSWFVLG